MKLTKILSGILASTMLLSAVSFSALATEETHEEPVFAQTSVDVPAESVETESVTDPQPETEPESDSAPADVPASDEIMTLPADETEQPVANDEAPLPPAEKEESAEDDLQDAPVVEPLPAVNEIMLLAEPEPLSQYLGKSSGLFHSVLDLKSGEEFTAYCYNYNYSPPPSHGAYYDRAPYLGQSPGPDRPEEGAKPGEANPELLGRVQRLMFAGWPFDSLGLQQKYDLPEETASGARFQTQLALWFALEQWYDNTFDKESVDALTAGYENPEDIPGYVLYRQQLLYAALGTLDDMLPKQEDLILNGSADVVFSWDEDAELYRSPLLSLTGFSGEYEIQAPNGITARSESGEETTRFHTGEEFYFTTTDGDQLFQSPEIAFAVSDYNYIYPDNVYLYNPLEIPEQGLGNYKLYQSLFTFETGEHTVSATQQFTLTVDKIIPPGGGEITPVPHGVMQVSKTDAEGNALDGASFVLYQERAADELTQKLYYTVKDSKADWTAELADAAVFSGSAFELPALPYGTYYLHETVVPDGYQTPTEDTSFTLSEPEAALTIRNIRKTDGGSSGSDDDDDDRPSRPGKPETPAGGGTVDVPEADVPLGEAPETGDPIVEIEDGETPLAEAPAEIVELGETAVPKAGAAPKTGDSAPLLPLLALLLASLGGCAALSRKKG